MEKDEEVGGFVVSCPGLPGCCFQGDMVEKALENIKEVIKACFISLAEDELKTTEGTKNTEEKQILSVNSASSVVGFLCQDMINR